MPRCKKAIIIVTYSSRPCRLQSFDAQLRRMIPEGDGSVLKRNLRQDKVNTIFL